MWHFPRRIDLKPDFVDPRWRSRRLVLGDNIQAGSRVAMAGEKPAAIVGYAGRQRCDEQLDRCRRAVLAAEFNRLVDEEPVPPYVDGVPVTTDPRCLNLVVRHGSLSGALTV